MSLSNHSLNNFIGKWKNLKNKEKFLNLTNEDTIRYSLFKEEDELTSLTIAKGNLTWRSRDLLRDCKKLKTLNLKNKIWEMIPYECFLETNSISKISLSGCVGLKKICNKNFINSKLIEFNLSGCINLEEIMIKKFLYSPIEALDLSKCMRLHFIYEDFINSFNQIILPYFFDTPKKDEKYEEPEEIFIQGNLLVKLAKMSKTKIEKHNFLIKAIEKYEISHKNYKEWWEREKRQHQNKKNEDMYESLEYIDAYYDDEIDFLEGNSTSETNLDEHYFYNEEEPLRYDQWIKENPNFYKLQNNLGVCFSLLSEITDDVVKKEEYLKESIENFRNAIKIYNNLKLNFKYVKANKNLSKSSFYLSQLPTPILYPLAFDSGVKK